MRKYFSISFYRRAAWLFFSCFVVNQYAHAQAFPEWSASDRARLKKGEIMVGQMLLMGTPPVTSLSSPAPDPGVPSLPDEAPELPYDYEFISQEYLDEYFTKVPSSYLVDPQRLLTRQEAMDREGFLAYHAGESAIDIRLYIFDAQQEIPYKYSVVKVAQELYAQSELTAVVFCFVGDPSRNLVAFGGRGAEKLEALEKRRAYESAVLKAIEKSETSAQVEAFILQLSIKLYWMEQAMIAATTTELIQVDAPSDKAADRVGTNVNDPPAGGVATLKPYFFYIAVGMSGILFVIGGLTGIFLLWKRNKRYHFPVLEIPCRLGANYAAGIGAVIAFHNKFGSPSAQREQVPDPLARDRSEW